MARKAEVVQPQPYGMVCVAAPTMCGFLRETAMQRFLQIAQLAWVFELAFSMNSLHDFGASPRSQ